VISSTSMRPEADEHHPYYAKYIALVPEMDPVAALDRQLAEMTPQLNGLTEAQGDLRYAPGKWSIKQVLQHLIDGERVFAYRALRAARADRTPLPGFEENDWAERADVDRRTVRDLVEEWTTLRRANVSLFAGLGDEALRRRTIANEHEISVRALAFIISGHSRHHLNLIRERYLA
jgi:hypothetical protein